jgi:integrase
MKNLACRNGIYEVRVQIPKDVQGAWGKIAEQRSLNTRDPNDAIVKAAPIIADIKRRIAAMRAGAVEPPRVVPRPSVGWSPDDAFDAIQRWAKGTTDRAYLQHFHGEAPAFDRFGDEGMAHSAVMHALQERRWADIAGFDDALVDAISSEGVPITRGHPAIPHLRAWFGEARETVEKEIERFRRGEFSQWSMAAPSEPLGRLEAPKEHSEAHAPPSGSLTISELLEAFIARECPAAKDESELRGYVRRLTEHLGDLPVKNVSTVALDGFLIKLRKFPVTKRPDILGLPFDEIVEQYGAQPGLPKLSNKTIRTKWFGGFNRLFRFAVSRKLAPENPVTAAMPKKRDDVLREREAWSPEQIGAMFAKPVFVGASSLAGYRAETGDLVRHDAKFWLPLIALWSGMRLDEIGAMRKDELKAEDGIWFFDLQGRPLVGYRRVKNAQSQRVVPVHQRLIELGLIRYAEAQAEWLFPELPHDAEDDGATTRHISKWFGHWRRANGLFDPDRMQDFHSLRHSFKDSCREAKLAEDVHDRLTGHAGSSNQQTSRGYGKGGSLKLLSDSMNSVEHPQFPMDRVQPFVVS